MVDFTRVAGFLAEHAEDVLSAADAAMARAHLPHYEQAGGQVARERLRALYLLVVRCASQRHLGPIAEHAARIAAERHAAGVGLGEVQTAINVLEESIWRVVMADLPAGEQGEALGVVGTILGAAKDELACRYVSLAAPRATRTLDLAELFHGPVEGDVAAR